MPTKKLLDVAVQTAEGLAKAHAAGIVHRDLKPENLMVSKDGFVKILDFGLAKLTEAVVAGRVRRCRRRSRAPTQPGTVMGTAGYMSPEQASGQPVDFRSDQFTLGAILYEMATGKRAFQRKTGAETLVAIIREEPEPLSQLAPKAPAPVRWIVERCLAKDPEERYASTKDLARDLKSVRDHLSETSFSGGLEAAEPAKARRRRWLVPALLALLRRSRLGFLLRAGLSRQAGRSDPVPAADLSARAHPVRALRSRRPDDRLQRGLGRPARSRSSRREPTAPSPARSGFPAPTCSRSPPPARSPSRSTAASSPATRPPGRSRASRWPGGAPREVLENVQDADWSPDGKALAVCRVVGNRSRLEYPIGKVLYETAGWVSDVRVSPDGGSLAFVDHPQRGNNDGHLKIVDTTGKVRLAGPFVRGFVGLAWSPEGRRGLVRRNRGDVGRRQEPNGLGLAERATSRTSRATGAFSWSDGTARARSSDIAAAGRSAAQPDRAQLVVPRRHLARRRHAFSSTSSNAEPPGDLPARARRLSGGSHRRGRGLRVLAGRTLGADR